MEGAAQTVLINVGQLVGQEFWQLRAVGGEIAELKEELATMNTLLRMQSEANESGLSHFVREWMKQLRELAYDAEDCVDLYLFRIRCRKGDGLLVWSKRLLVTLFPRHRLAGEIRALRLRAVSISERHARYVVSLDLLGRTASSEPSQEVAASARALRPDNNPNLFVGIKAAEDLANKVKSEAGMEKDRELKVFSIVGFGGLGKTTLAMEVCRQLETEFQRQAKVSVSQTFSSKDLEGLLKRMLRQVVRLPNKASEQADLLGKIDMMDLDDLDRELRENLQDNRYLILIDNVWSTTAWDAIQSKLPRNNCSSRIIVTTRIANVANVCSNSTDYYIHHMKALYAKESKMLFLSKAFGSMTEDPCPCPPSLKDGMETILKKCCGLPLAIVSVARLLSCYSNSEWKNMWEIVGRSIGSQTERNPSIQGMKQILTFSYDHLPYHLKVCMMYLSIFPEDYVICKDRLLKRWIAQGLIPEEREMTQMDLAEAYFNELVSRCMIYRGTDTVTICQWREETCRVHDMILEVMVSKSLESNFVSLVGGRYEGMCYDWIRRLTIHGGEAPPDSSSKRMAAYPVTRNDFKEMPVQHVRSLSIFDPKGHKLLTRLGDFTLLRVLDLEDCQGLEEKYIRHICRMYLLRFLRLKGTDIKSLPSTIGDLEHLQTLDVRQTQLRRLPSRIGDLKHLETLDVRQTQLKSLPSRLGDLEHLQTLDLRQTQLTSLPETVTKLKKLEHLLFSTKGNIWSGLMLPQGINEMKALRHLSEVVVTSDSKVAKGIGELCQLQELRICVDTGKDINPNVLRDLACSLARIYSLQCLDIGNLSCQMSPFVRILDFLHDVETPPRLLRYLRICGCFDKLPEWVGSLPNLIEFDISWSDLDGDQLFNVLCKLSNLTKLTLGSYFLRKGQHMVACSGQSFPKLKELILGYSPEDPQVYMFEEGCMPKLETLVLNYGDQGKKIVGIEHLTNLKEVQINTVSDSPGWVDALEVLEVLKVENDRRYDSKRELIRVTVR